MLDKLSDEQKSVMLTTAMGLSVSDKYQDHTGAWFIKVQGTEPINALSLDLYSPANMALAWRVHIWALGNLPDPLEYKYYQWFKGIKLKQAPWTLLDAQRLWLDMILSLAIEAGIVEVQDA
jgi:hypothetical protein